MAAHVGLQEPAERAKPRLRDWDPYLAELTRQSDQISNLISVLVKRWGGNAKFEPRPRPETAMDRLREWHRRTKHEQLVARLIPKS